MHNFPVATYQPLRFLIQVHHSHFKDNSNNLSHTLVFHQQDLQLNLQA
jgi:hypothetical protein